MTWSRFTAGAPMRISLAPILMLLLLAAGGAYAGELSDKAKVVFGVLPASAPRADNPSSEPRVALGRTLYFDPRLSKNHDISCNSCHRLDRAGVDGEATSPGHKGQRGNRNSPTTLNAALHLAQFWDGREPDVEAQAKGPVLNPVEMAMPSAQSVDRLLLSIPGYGPMFEAAFPGEESPVSFDNAALAIGAFERMLMTSGPFDAFMQGDERALSQQAREGLQTFMDVGCITCHNGPVVGGATFQKLGLVEAYETDDQGRFEVTGQESDRKVFKVPSLRNVSDTGPYFHDGSIKTLPAAVRLMGRHQLGVTLNADQVADVVAFLGSLSGRVPPAMAAAPKLPPSGPDTPKPDPN